jgi:hypothetical protein
MIVVEDCAEAKMGPASAGETMADGTVARRFSVILGLAKAGLPQ